MKKRWTKYFEQVLNVEVKYKCSWRLLDDCFGRIERKNNIDRKSREVVNEMKSGKAPGLDVFLLKCLKKSA